MKILVGCLLLSVSLSPRGIAQVTAVVTAGEMAAAKTTALATHSLEESGSPQRVRDPVMGYIPSSSGPAISPLLGVPGAATLGSPMDLGISLQQVEISPARGYVLGVAEDSGAVFQLDLLSGKPLTILPALPAPDRIVYSSRGKAAAFYHRRSSSAQVVRSLPAAPDVSLALEWAGLLGVLTAMAVSDDGDALLLAFSEARGDSVVVVQQGVAPLRIGTFSRVSALSFLPDSQSAVIADAAANLLWLAENVLSGGALTVLAGKQDGISGPIGVAASAGTGKIIVLNGNTNTISIVDIPLGSSESIPCQCDAAGLFATAEEGRWRLTAAHKGLIALLDTNKSEASVILVPGGESVISPLPTRPRRGRVGR